MDWMLTNGWSHTLLRPDACIAFASTVTRHCGWSGPRGDRSGGHWALSTVNHCADSGAGAPMSKSRDVQAAGPEKGKEIRLYGGPGRRLRRAAPLPDGPVAQAFRARISYPRPGASCI